MMSIKQWVTFSFAETEVSSFSQRSNLKKTFQTNCPTSLANAENKFSVFVPRQLSLALPGFCNGGEVRYGSIGGLEYEVPQSRLYCLCINVTLCSTTLQCICRVIRRSSMTMKAHTYYIIFGRPPTGRKLPPGGATGSYYAALSDDIIHDVFLFIFP